jgi:hypothetical protein
MHMLHGGDVVCGIGIGGDSLGSRLCVMVSWEQGRQQVQVQQEEGVGEGVLGSSLLMGLRGGLWKAVHGSNRGGKIKHGGCEEAMVCLWLTHMQDCGVSHL